MSRLELPRSAAVQALLLAAALAVVAATPPCLSAASEGDPAPRIFKWVDEHGIAHYTTDESRIPRSVRRRLRSLPEVATPAPASPAPEPDLIGPRPETPEHPEAWVTRNAPPRPTEEEQEAAADAELAARLSEVDAQIAGLEGEIADREEQILALLAAAQGDTLREDPAFRALAEELPALQADLEALRERRVAIATNP